MAKNLIPKIFLVVLAMTILSMFASAVATSTVSLPTASSFHSTTMQVGCNTTSTAVTNATMIYGLAGGTNFTVAMVNTSANQLSFSNLAVSISARTDSASYIFTCVAVNAENVTYSASVTGVTIDNTAPTVSSTISKKNIEYMQANKATCTASDGIDSSLTMQINLTKPNNGGSASTSDLSHTFVSSDTNKLGSYTYYCTATDDSGNAAVSSQTFNVKGADGAAVTEQVSRQQAQRASGGMTQTQKVSVGVVIVLIIAIASVFLMTKKKVRRR